MSQFFFTIRSYSYLKVPVNKVVPNRIMNNTVLIFS